MPKYDRFGEEIIEYRPSKLQTNRSMWKLMLLSILTCGLYSIFFFIPFSFDIDKVTPREDRSQTMNYLFAFALSLVTFSIVLDVWHYSIASRVESALENRKIDYNFGTTDFWGWLILGSLILIGPFVYYHKLCKAMNLLCAAYNEETGAQ